MLIPSDCLHSSSQDRDTESHLFDKRFEARSISTAKNNTRHSVLIHKSSPPVPAQESPTRTFAFAARNGK